MPGTHGPRKVPVTHLPAGTSVSTTVKLDLKKLHEALIGAAQAQVPSDAVPYAFERRVMARLQSAAAPNAWVLWGQALWRAAAACVAIAALCSVWSFWPAAGSAESATLESTVFAAAQELVDVW